MTALTNTRYLALVLGLLFGGLALSGCNTVSGAGQDIEAAGDAVTDTSEDVQDDL